MSASRATKQTRAIVPHVGRIIRASRAGKYRCNATPIYDGCCAFQGRALDRCALHCSAFLSMWHRVDARYVPYGDLANHTFVEPSAASGIVCSLWWGQFASRFCVSCGRCVRARAWANAHVHACNSRSSCVGSSARMAIAAASVCAYARARTRESLRMSLVTPGVTPGFALTIPGYQHRPPCTTDREELHYALLTILAPCAKHCREPPRRCSLCEVCIALIRCASASST